MSNQTPGQDPATAAIVADINAALAAMSAPVRTDLFRVAYTTTGRYEVHAAGCRHLTAPRIEFHVAAEGATGAEAAARFTAANEGCTATLGPCAR